MKARSFGIRVGIAVVACAATAVTATAQFAPQRGYAPPSQSAYGAAPTATARQQVAYQAANLPPSYRQPAAAYQPQSVHPPVGYPQTAHQPPAGYPQAGYPQVALQDAPALPTPAEPVETGDAEASAVGHPTDDTDAPEVAPVTGGDCGCECQSTEFGYGAPCGIGGTCDALGGGKLIRPNACRQWFVGLYSLGLTRDNPGSERLAVLVDSPAAYPYYPAANTTILSTGNLDQDYQWGGEIRLGSTFGCACNPCNPCGNIQPFAWEIAYWGIEDDGDMAGVTDVWSDTDRIYGTVNYAGIQYDRDGAGATYGYRPVNDYYDYQMPIEDPATDPNNVRVLGLRVRNSFRAQNLELNFLRFAMPGCGGGCGGCNPCGPSAARFSFNGLMGVRYMRLDENFQLASMFTTVDAGGVPLPGEPTTPIGFSTIEDNVIFHDIDVDNELLGFQIGSNMNYQASCRLSFFCDTMFGIYGNSIDASQRVWSGGGGDVQFVNGGAVASVASDKDDVAFLGEARLGGAYQLTCNCRLTAAYRVIGISGVALAVEQIPTDFSNPEHVGYIDSNDSLVLHGIQFGAEFKY